MATFKKIRQVTLPVLKLEKGVPRYLFILSPMYVGDKLEEQKDAATLVHSVDMETGEEGLVICPSVMQSELLKNYPDDSYVRKGFEIVVTRGPAGKNYNLVTISEVAPPDDFDPPASSTVSIGRTPASKAGRKPGSTNKAGKGE